VWAHRDVDKRVGLGVNGGHDDELPALRGAAVTIAAQCAARLTARGASGYYISDVIDSLDLGAFHARYEGGGPRNQPFQPAMMVKVLVYGYATGVFSSRKIARKRHEDVAFRVLGAGNSPAHRTICDFRADS